MPKCSSNRYQTSIEYLGINVYPTWWDSSLKYLFPHPILYGLSLHFHVLFIYDTLDKILHTSAPALIQTAYFFGLQICLLTHMSHCVSPSNLHFLDSSSILLLCNPVTQSSSCMTKSCFVLQVPFSHTTVTLPHPSIPWQSGQDSANSSITMLPLLSQHMAILWG